VHDEVSGVPIAVWYDPISNATAVFKRELLGAPEGHASAREFRLAGLLVHGTSALYDAGTKSLVSPLDGMAVTGPLSGARLEFLPYRVTTFGDFAAIYKEGETLAKPRGTPFDYGVNPFADFQEDESLIYMKVTDD